MSRGDSIERRSNKRKSHFTIPPLPAHAYNRAMALEPIYTVASIREIEHQAHAAALMERAGAAAAGVAQALLARERARVLVLAGPGNNGGDAFVVARHLHAAGHAIVAVFCTAAEKVPHDARAAYDRWLAVGGSTVPAWPPEQRFDLIVDGLFGIGLTRGIDEPYATLVALANASGTPILALDIASGFHADTGFATGPVIRATHTATFIACKPGLLTGEGVALSGGVSVHALGLDAHTLAKPDGYRLDWPEFRTRIPARHRDAHKGTHGTLAIIGGAEGMTGAALLAGRAALHSGAGKVFIGFVGDASAAVDFIQPELMLRAAETIDMPSLTALAVGPGLGRSERARVALDSALKSELPLVLDADALNFLAQDASLAQLLTQRASPTLLTPHPAEAARLLRRSTEDVQRDRLAAAKEIAATFRCGVVLKGAGSVCAFADGHWFINATGNPGLASAGTGDVLTGIVGALLAQGLGAEDALLAGVCLHGAAADALVARGAGPIGLTASDVVYELRALLNRAAGTTVEGDTI